jgi:hypothetical protein
MLKPQVLVLAAAIAASTVHHAMAQGTTATISGAVSDSSGSIVANARVTGTNIETNVSRNTTSDAGGNYSLRFLSLGTYRVEVTAAGFKKFEQTGVVLEINRNARVDAVLQVGGVTETVEVQADVSAVETAQPALGNVVTNKEIETLPLVNRDLYTLLTLTAGVDTTDAATDNFGAPMQATLMNGSPNSSIGSVNYTLDGSSNTNGLRNTGNTIPNPDAVQEFKVVTNGYSAEYGRFGGGQVSMVTKSGTNRISGSLFEFIRNDDLNASRWVPGLSTLQKDPLHRNQFGGSIGGPLIKNKTFYFGSYSGLRERTTIFKNDATPLTASERLGDLSASGGTAPVDPLNNNIAFPDRLIPVSRFDPVAKKVTDTYIPLPNTGARFEVQIAHPRDTDDVTIKMDHNLNTAHRLTGSIFYSTGVDAVGLIGNLPWVTRSFEWDQYNYNASDTWIVTPSKINEFRVAYIRNFGGRINFPQMSLGDLGSQFKIQGVPSLPVLNVAGRFNLNSALAGPVAGSNQYQVRDTFSMNTRRHNLRMGGEATLEKMVHDALLTNYGNFAFQTNNPRGTRNAVADWLLGLPSTMTQDAPTTKINNSWYFALFLQDDFKVTPRLTVNIGLRYDVQPPITDPKNRVLTFVPGAQSKIVTVAPVGLQFPGDPGIGRGIIDTDMNNISPRIGIAWDPFADRKTAIRASIGVFYGGTSGNQWNSSADNQPFAIRQTFNEVQSLTNPYGLLPGGVSPFPYVYSPSAPRFLPPSSVSGVSLDYASPYSYQMNFAVQRQFTASTNFTFAYVNQLWHRIPTSVDRNYPVLTPTATTGNVNARRPYLPNVLSVIGMTSSILNSSFHGLQITGEKRLSHHFSMKGFYSFGKGLDMINTQNSTAQAPVDWNNIRLDRGRANNDRTHAMVFSGIWDLNYFRHAPMAVRLVAGGWSLSAITTFRSGAPLTITAGSDRNFDGNTNDRADLIGGEVKRDPNRARSAVVDQWFNPAAFSSVTQASHNFVGTAGRGIIDGPGVKNVDLGIFRDFRIAERKKLQFRAEATNGFNLVNLSNPGTNAGSTANIGRITTARPMRQIQLGLRLTF